MQIPPDDIEDELEKVEILKNELMQCLYDNGATPSRSISSLMQGVIEILDLQFFTPRSTRSLCEGMIRILEAIIRKNNGY
jgi:hypothetical protein